MNGITAPAQDYSRRLLQRLAAPVRPVVEEIIQSLLTELVHIEGGLVELRRALLLGDRGSQIDVGPIDVGPAVDALLEGLRGEADLVALRQRLESAKILQMAFPKRLQPDPWLTRFFAIVDVFGADRADPSPAPQVLGELRMRLRSLEPERKAVLEDIEDLARSWNLSAGGDFFINFPPGDLSPDIRAQGVLENFFEHYQDRKPLNLTARNDRSRRVEDPASARLSVAARAELSDALAVALAAFASPLATREQPLRVLIELATTLKRRGLEDSLPYAFAHQFERAKGATLGQFRELSNNLEARAKLADAPDVAPKAACPGLKAVEASIKEEIAAIARLPKAEQVRTMLTTMLEEVARTGGWRELVSLASTSKLDVRKLTIKLAAGALEESERSDAQRAATAASGFDTSIVAPSPAEVSAWIAEFRRVEHVTRFEGRAPSSADVVILARAHQQLDWLQRKRDDIRELVVAMARGDRRLDAGGSAFTRVSDENLSGMKLNALLPVLGRRYSVAQYRDKLRFPAEKVKALQEELGGKATLLRLEPDPLAVLRDLDDALERLGVSGGTVRALVALFCEADRFTGEGFDSLVATVRGAVDTWN